MFWIFTSLLPTWTYVLLRIHKQMTTTMRSQPVVI